MTKLKTLKDITSEIYYETDVTVYKIRQEAIKWIKGFPKYGEDNEFNSRCCDCGTTLNVKKWIKQFFNISEEDLE